jgi:hypothetical protein
MGEDSNRNGMFREKIGLLNLGWKYMASEKKS